MHVCLTGFYSTAILRDLQSRTIIYQRSHLGPTQRECTPDLHRMSREEWGILSTIRVVRTTPSLSKEVVLWHQCREGLTTLMLILQVRTKDTIYPIQIIDLPHLMYTDIVHQALRSIATRPIMPQR